MQTLSRPRLLAVLTAGLLIALWTYRQTYFSLVNTWLNDTAYSYGFLVLPIVIWLIWKRRSEVAAAVWRPSWLGALALAACGMVWVVGRGTGVQIIEQIGAVGIAVSTVAAVLGLSVAWALAFPLAFAFFLVPFGKEMVPWFMQVTADIATPLLRWSGIPIYRTETFIYIPEGSFEVARACSGLKYVVTACVLGALYANLSYRSWWKRAICVLVFLVVPIVANGLRVYFIILTSHLTDMRFGPGAEHVEFGRVFFVAIMFLTFWVGRRWSDDPEPDPVIRSDSTTMPVTPDGSWVPVFLSLLLIALPPNYLAAIVNSVANGVEDVKLSAPLPAGQDGWSGPSVGQRPWRPLFSGELLEQAGSYVDPNGHTVDVWVGVYGLGATAGAEMIRHGNRISPSEDTSFVPETDRVVTLRDGGQLRVRERMVRDVEGDRRVWYWYLVGDSVALSDVAVKMREVLAFMSLDGSPERVVTLSAAGADADSLATLERFMIAHSECARSGFAAGACK